MPLENGIHRGQATPACESVRSAIFGACAYCVFIFVDMLILWLPTYE
jgi:hypothetical protein